MPNFRRGAEAIEAAAESKGNSDFKPFAPTLRWTENGEEKYVLILTPISKTPTLNVHEFVEIGTRDNGKPIFGFFAYRKDKGIGEKTDVLEDEFGIKPSERVMGVGVELEPEYESSSSSRRPRVKRFKVATDTYDRKNEDGTTEEVTFPLVGIISQAAGNFYNHVRSHDADYGPIEELPLKIKRIGKGKDTQYSLTPFMDQETDLSNLVDYIDGISYVPQEIREKVKNQDTDVAVQVIAEAILDTRLEELSDKDTYDTAVYSLDEIKGYAGKVYTRNSNNGSASVEEPEEVEEEDISSEEDPDDRDAVIARIKQRAAATKSKK